MKSGLHLTKKAVLSAVLIAALVLALTVGAFGAGGTRQYDFVKPDVSAGEFAVNVNGRWIDCGADRPYAIGEGREAVYYVPLAPVSEELGAAVAGGTVAYGNAVVSLEGMLYNGVGELDANGAYVPLTFWAEAFAAESFAPDSPAYKVIGGKTMTDGQYLYVTLTDDETDYVMAIDGESYTFAAGRYSDGEYTVPYRYAAVNDELPGDGALIVFLHGNSYRGYDNIMQLKLTPAATIVKYFTDKGIKGHVLVPQCTNTTQAGWTVLTDDLAAVIEGYIAEHEIDPSRVYVTGCSMGGHGTWGMLRDHADLFAAAMPISGNADSPMCNIDVSEITAEVPLYMLVGGGDSQTMRDGMSAFAADFAAKGGTVVYEIESITLKILAVEGKVALPLIVFPLLTVKPPMTFLVFVVLAFFIKNRERIFRKSGKTHEDYQAFLKTNRNSLQFSRFTAIILAAAGILDIVAFFVVSAILSQHTPEGAELAEDFYLSHLNALGLGDSVLLLLLSPLMLLFSYTRTHRNKMPDTLIPFAGVVLIALVYIEGGYQFLLMVPDLLASADFGGMGGLIESGLGEMGDFSGLLGP